MWTQKITDPNWCKPLNSVMPQCQLVSLDYQCFFLFLFFGFPDRHLRFFSHHFGPYFASEKLPWIILFLRSFCIWVIQATFFLYTVSQEILIHTHGSDYPHHSGDSQTEALIQAIFNLPVLVRYYT